MSLEARVFSDSERVTVVPGSKLGCPPSRSHDRDARPPYGTRAMVNGLTIDVEEHFQVHNMECVVSRDDWHRHTSRVEANVRRVLKLLSEHRTHATFFVLGWVAERHPELLGEIREGGHEIASHGYWHELIYRQTPAQFSADIGSSLDAIERACGVRPESYRAPCFSITKDSLWALDVLRENGIRFDSSIVPISGHDRYGLKGASRFVSRLPNGIWEAPVSTVRMAGRNWPVGGGGYFRLFPLWLTRRAIRRINGEGQPAILYLHPWEFDPEQPRIQGIDRLARFRHYHALDRTESRLRSLLCEVRFGSLHECLASRLSESVRPSAFAQTELISTWQ
jgi:polysaccharide deacetylase family protein (PEP-CTERM system associated)